MLNVTGIYEYGVDLHRSRIRAGILDDVPDADSSNVFAVLEKSRRQNFVGDLIKGLPLPFPDSENAGASALWAPYRIRSFS